jgi:hypothetical protein
VEIAPPEPADFRHPQSGDVQEPEQGFVAGRGFGSQHPLHVSFY